MIFRRFPYTTLNDINLDWIIKQVKQIAAALRGKQDKPDATGAAGQVLGLDESLNPVWLDQSGGGGTTNYNNLSNKPQINSVTLSGNKTAADLGLANASDIPTVPVQSVNGQTGAVELDAADVGALPSDTFIPGYSLQLPVMDGEASAGTTYARYSMEGHRHPTDTSRASNSDIGIVQNTNTATQNISVGQYVIWQGALYTASAAIATGAALSSSNLTMVTGGGLNALLAEKGTIKNPFEIQANTDLNNLLDVGVYYSPLGTVSATLSNYPGNAVAFSLLCLKALGGAVSLQIIFTDEKVYIRRYGNGVWNNWYSYSGTIIQ